MKTSSLTWAVYNDSMSVLYEAGKLWKCLPSHSQIDLTYIDLIITCNHSRAWVVMCLMPGPGLFSQTNHLTSDLPQCWRVCVGARVRVRAVMPVSRIRWSSGEGCTSCDGCISITPRVFFFSSVLKEVKPQVFILCWESRSGPSAQAVVVYYRTVVLYQSSANRAIADVNRYFDDCNLYFTFSWLNNLHQQTT